MRMLENRTAIITGAGGGIGQATALLLASHGASLVLADINGNSAASCAEQVTQAGGKAMALRCDIAAEDDMRSLIETATRHFGALDILVNNAAASFADDRDICSMDAEVWDQTMRVNTRGTMLGCKYAIPAMLARGGGAIVNISSGAALSGQLSLPAYAAAKAAIVSLTRSVATIHGRQGIRCNAIAPGLIMHRRLAKFFPQEQVQIDRDNVLCPRQGTPEDIANAVLFLASDQSAFINAQVLAVDGGLLAHSPGYAQTLALAGAAAD